MHSSIWPLSVIIISKNAAPFIGRCLASVQWAAEIIVLDSGSGDDTIAICQQYTDKVYSTDWPGYGQQKNRALAKATHHWVLSMDADEWLSDDLQNEIKQVVTHSTADAFAIIRQNQYCGHWLRTGFLSKDRIVRLFKRNQGQFSNYIVHEGVVMASHSIISHLKSPLYHESSRTLEEALERLNRYSSLSAQMRYQQGQKSSLIKAITHGLWAFLKSYFFQLGFLDGQIGFIVAVYYAEHSYYRHLKLFFYHPPEKS